MRVDWVLLVALLLCILIWVFIVREVWVSVKDGYFGKPEVVIVTDTKEVSYE